MQDSLFANLLSSSFAGRALPLVISAAVTLPAIVAQKSARTTGAVPNPLGTMRLPQSINTAIPGALPAQQSSLQRCRVNRKPVGGKANQARCGNGAEFLLGHRK
jgi:hypothetical protein